MHSLNEIIKLNAPDTRKVAALFPSTLAGRAARKSINARAVASFNRAKEGVSRGSK